MCIHSPIFNAYKSTLEKIGKQPKTKSLDETYDGGKNVREAESKELDPSELAGVRMYIFSEFFSRHFPDFYMYSRTFFQDLPRHSFPYILN